MTTTEELQNGKRAIGLFEKIVIPLILSAVIGGLTLWSDQKVTASALAEHKAAEESRLSELRADIRSLRDELRSDIQNLRQAVERKR